MLARLDTVYHADGRLGIDRVFDSRTRQPDRKHGFEVIFPRFWVGPIWLQVRGPDPTAETTIDLVWGPWRRRQRVRSGTVITTRKATTDAPELAVKVPTDWGFAAGLGAVPTAVDINKGWFPVSAKAAVSLIRDGLAAVANGFRT
ncbi:hypothetical protein ACQP2X_39250 [Actinoplanes sp. CA-131856]